MRRSALVLAAVTAAAVPCPALADVPVAVPTAFLGGPIWSPLPAVTIHAAGVGKIDRQSPIMYTKAVEINFNPTWTVPASIIRKDLISPKKSKENGR